MGGEGRGGQGGRGKILLWTLKKALPLVCQWLCLHIICINSIYIHLVVGALLLVLVHIHIYTYSGGRVAIGVYSI
jgi:hypothetical protein